MRDKKLSDIRQRIARLRAFVGRARQLLELTEETTAEVESKQDRDPPKEDSDRRPGANRYARDDRERRR